MSEDIQEIRLQQQRKWTRLECRAHIHYRIGSAGTFKAGLASDISEGGIKFEAGRRIPPRTVLWLVIQLPLHIKSIKTKAEVVSACETEINGTYEIGVRFLGIRKNAQQRIARYIDEITSEVDEDEAGFEGIETLGAETESLPATGQIKSEKEKGADIPALIEEIKALRLIIDEEKETCQLGKLATFSFPELKGCPPLMLGLKFAEAVAEPLLKRYGLKAEEMEEAMEKCKKKFKALGTTYYVHVLKRK